MGGRVVRPGTGLLAVVVAFLSSFQLNGEEITDALTPSECNPELLQSWPSHCKPYRLFNYVEGNSNYSQQVACHFENQISVYSYQVHNQYFLDVKGLSGNAGQRKNSTWIFNSCSELEKKVLELNDLEFQSFSDLHRINSSTNEPIFLVASNFTCDQLSDELQDLLAIYKDEGRAHSQLLCIKDQIIRERNPSQVREEIWKQIDPKRHSHLFLIGSDIPVFELFTDQADYVAMTHYGNTDLPYGDQYSEFFKTPLSKTSEQLRERVYKSENYIWKMDHPTPFAYDIGAFVEELRASDEVYRQEVSVSRWIEKEDLKRDFRHYVQKRRAYQPVKQQNVVSMEGGSGVLFRPGRHRGFFRVESELHSSVTEGESHRVFDDVLLDRAMMHLDPQTSFLQISEHGTWSSIGDLHAYEVDALTFLPDFINLSSCYGGAWTLASEPSRSLVSSFLNSRAGAVSVVAGQGIKYFKNFGSSDILVQDVMLSNWEKGQSLGDRQIESFMNNFDYLKAKRPDWQEKSIASDFIQLFSMPSIFGDPTIER